MTGLTLNWVLYLIAGAVDGDGPSGLLVALFSFATLTAFEALGPVAGAFQHLEQVIACTVRLNSLVQQTPEVIFSRPALRRPRVSPSASTGYGFIILSRQRLPLTT